MNITQERRRAHERWLLDLTAIPTAAGHEHRVIAWLESWLAERPALQLTRDEGGNLHVQLADRTGLSGRPVYFTAHMDHPAFVVEQVVAPGTLLLAFRGGVMDDYFNKARVEVHTSDDARLGATLLEKTDGPNTLFKFFLAELDDEGREVEVGDIATWELPPAEIADGQIHTNACDDLAALAAALGAIDELHRAREAGETVLDVRLLLTRAEEIGFVGAIGACRWGTMPKDARVIALENSRAFDDAPIGGGPIVRVGDRLSIFSPSLTAAVAARAEAIAGGPSSPNAQQKQTDLPTWRWQRKLMAGGACEATVYVNAGYEAMCVCLPLGNYHNMADLDAVQAGTNETPPRVGREHVAVSDFHGLVDLLIACGIELSEAGAMDDKLQKLWDERKFVLEE